MPFGINLSGNRSKSTTTSASSSNTNGSGTFSNTTTPTLVDWASSAVQGATGRAQDLLGRDPTSFVTGPNGLQQQAAAGAASLTGLNFNYDAAADLTRGAGKM